LRKIKEKTDGFKEYTDKQAKILQSMMDSVATNEDEE
jgi:hypothetical protein